MTPRDFCYWLQGLLELSDADKNKAAANETLSKEQVECIKKHLGYVFAAMNPPIVVQDPTAGGLAGLIAKGVTSAGTLVC